MSYGCGTAPKKLSRTSRSTPFPTPYIVSFDCSFEWTERVILLQVGVQRLSIRMRLELMNQLLDCFLAGVIMLLDGRMCNPWILKSISPRQLSLYAPPPQVSLCLLEWSSCDHPSKALKLCTIVPSLCLPVHNYFSTHFRMTFNVITWSWASVDLAHEGALQSIVVTVCESGEQHKTCSSSSALCTMMRSIFSWSDLGPRRLSVRRAWLSCLL